MAVIDTTKKGWQAKALAARRNMPNQGRVAIDPSSIGFSSARQQTIDKDTIDNLTIHGRDKANVLFPDAVTGETVDIGNHPALLPEATLEPTTDPTFTPLGRGYPSNFSAYTPEGADHPIYTNLGKSELMRELESREIKNGINSVTGSEGSRYFSNKKIPADTLKRLENIGLVTKGNMNPSPQKQQTNQRTPPRPVRSDTPRNYPESYPLEKIKLLESVMSGGGRSTRPDYTLDSPLEFNRITDSTRSVGGGSPSSSGFFESLGRFSSAVRANKEARSDYRFNRKQNREDKIATADINQKNKTASWYDDDMKSKIAKRAADAKAAEAKANRWDAQAREVPFDAKARRILDLARAGDRNAMAELRRVKIKGLPALQEAELNKLLAETEAMDIENTLMSNLTIEK